MDLQPALRMTVATAMAATLPRMIAVTAMVATRPRMICGVCNGGNADHDCAGICDEQAPKRMRGATFPEGVF